MPVVKRGSQSPSPGPDEKYWACPVCPPILFESAGGVLFTVMLGQVFAYSALIAEPLLEPRVGIGLDRLDRAFRFTPRRSRWHSSG